MVQVKCEYGNFQLKNKKNDFFIFTNIEVIGHADYTGMNHTTGIKLCAGISACCHGIIRLIDNCQYKVECSKGYFHVWTDRIYNLREQLDRDTIYALNTLVCQLYELYVDYPKYFKSFDLVDVKERIEDEQRKRSEQQWSGYEPRRKKRNLQRMDICSVIEGKYPQEN